MGLQKQKLIRFKLQFNGADSCIELRMGFDYQSFIKATRDALIIAPDHPIFFFLINNYQNPGTIKRLELTEALYTHLLLHCASSENTGVQNFLIEVTDFTEFNFGDSQLFPMDAQGPLTCIHCQTKIAGSEYFKCVLCTGSDVVYCLVCATTGFNNFHVHPLLYVKLPVHYQYIQKVAAALDGANANSNGPTNPQPVQQLVEPTRIASNNAPKPIENLRRTRSPSPVNLKRLSRAPSPAPPQAVQEPEPQPVPQSTAKVFVYPKKHTNWFPKDTSGEYKVQIIVDNQSTTKFDKSYCFRRVKGNCNSPSEYVTPIIKPSSEKEFGFNLSMNKIGTKSVWTLCKRANESEAHGGYIVFECMDAGIRLYTIDALKFKSLNC